MSENVRSAVLLQFPCEQIHAGVPTWTDKVWATSNIPAFNRPVRIHCKTGSQSARLVFETRAKCQDFVARHNDDGVPYEVDSSFCNIKAQYWCVNPSHQKTEKLGDVLHRFGKFWFQNYKKSSLAEMLRMARPMCDGRPFASSPFRRLASRGLLFLHGFPVWWPFQIAFYICRRLSPYNQVSHCEGISRPYDTLSC